MNTEPNGGNSSPVLSPVTDEQLMGFQAAYDAALQNATETDAPDEPSEDDLIQLRERLLDKPVGESEELSVTRQRILDNPEELREFYRTLSRHDEAMRAVIEGEEIL